MIILRCDNSTTCTTCTTYTSPFVSVT